MPIDIDSTIDAHDHDDADSVTPLASHAEPTPDPRPFLFDHHRLHAYDVALAALVRGEAIAKTIPRGHASFVDQLRRALAGAFLQTTEAAARTGADRLARFARRAVKCAKRQAQSRLSSGSGS